MAKRKAPEQPETFEAWLERTRRIRDGQGRKLGKWRMRALVTILDVVEETIAETPNIHSRAILKIVDAAYPFGSRQYQPYKMWLEERRIFYRALAAGQAPTEEDAAACMVARDLVEMQKLDEAAAILDEQAPRRLSRFCPVCGERPGSDCREVYYGENHVRLTRPMPVPHEARVMPPRTPEEARMPLASGPLFDHVQQGAAS